MRAMGPMGYVRAKTLSTAINARVLGRELLVIDKAEMGCFGRLAVRWHAGAWDHIRALSRIHTSFLKTMAGLASHL